MSDVRVTSSYDYNAICDSCGLQFKASQLKKRWDGLMVCKDDWEQRHISDFYYTRNDTHILPYIRTKEAYTAYPVFDDPATATDATSYAPTHQLKATTNALFNAADFTNFTLMAWVKPATRNRVHTILGNRENIAANSFSFGVGGLAAQTASQGVLRLENANGTTVLSMPNQVPYGTWSHVCIQKDNTLGNYRMWLNGAYVPIHTNSFTSTPIPDSGSPLYVGRATTGASLRAFVGGLRDVRLWTRLLTPLEIQQSMSNMSTFLGSNTGLLLWYKLNEGTGTTCADSCTNGVPMTMTNAAGNWFWEQDTH